MNKIIVDKENNIVIKNNALIIDILVNELTINIEGKVLINEIKSIPNEELTLNIIMSKNSSLVYNRFIINSKMNNKINLIQEDNSNIDFNYSLIANDNCHLIINSTLNGNNNITNINVRTSSKNNGSTKIESTANIKPNIKDNNLLESIKSLNLNDSENIIIPNLLVSSDEVEVNHAATISGLDKDYLFYLNSKGISTHASENLIERGFLLSNLSLNEELEKKIIELMGGE